MAYMGVSWGWLWWYLNQYWNGVYGVVRSESEIHMIDKIGAAYMITSAWGQSRG